MRLHMRLWGWITGFIADLIVAPVVLNPEDCTLWHSRALILAKAQQKSQQQGNNYNRCGQKRPRWHMEGMKGTQRQCGIQNPWNWDYENIPWPKTTNLYREVFVVDESLLPSPTIHLIYISSSSPPPPPSTYQNPSEPPKLNLFRFPCFGQKPTTSRPSSNPQPTNSYFHPLCFHFYTFPTGVCWFYLLWSSARPGSRVRFTIQLRAQLEMPTHWFYFLSCTIWTTFKYVSHFLLRLLGLSQDKCVVCNLTQCG